MAPEFLCILHGFGTYPATTESSSKSRLLRADCVRGIIMKFLLPVVVTCVFALCVSPATASVFAGSGGNQLQSVASPRAYEFVDVADYQTELNSTLMGAVEVDLAPTPEIVGKLGQSNVTALGTSLLLGNRTEQALPGGDTGQSLFSGSLKQGKDGPQATWWWYWWRKRRDWDDGGGGGVTPAPEPATWILLATSLATAGLFVSRRWSA
jgi:hypothetical protein